MKEPQKSLIEYMKSLQTVDCHEHLVPERDRLERDVDVLTLVSLYAFVDVLSAGFPSEGRKTGIGNNHALDTSVPLEQRWLDLWPYLQRIKFGSYYRPTAIALQDLHGIEDLNESTWQLATERIRAENTKGLYTRVLRDRCGIRTCVVQNGKIEGQDPPELFTPLYSHKVTVQLPSPDFLSIWEERFGAKIEDLETYLECFEQELTQARAAGAVGFKMGARKVGKPDRKAARKGFAEFLKGAPASEVLLGTVLDFVLGKAGEWNWPIAVHCGIWGDYRTSDPKHMINLVMAYPQVRFDLYHLGMPFVRDCIFIAKNFPNAYLNLCWCYAISEEITRRAISEILDVVPVNKTFAFGADYIYAVENVYGHLVVAREALADVLTERIRRGRLDLEGAKEISRLWLADNPAQFYGLDKGKEET